MGRGVAQCSVGIPNNSEEVHGRNSVLSIIRSGSNYTGRNKPLQCPGFRIQPHQEFRINAKTIELARRYNRDVRRREFGAGDLVLWKVVKNARDVNTGKLAPT